MSKYFTMDSNGDYFAIVSEYESEEREMIEVTSVSRSMGITINLGNYESAREDVSMTANVRLRVKNLDDPFPEDEREDPSLVIAELEGILKGELDRIRKNYAHRQGGK